jgi:hypothetical protein
MRVRVDAPARNPSAALPFARPLMGFASLNPSYANPTTRFSRPRACAVIAITSRSIPLALAQSSFR